MPEPVAGERRDSLSDQAAETSQWRVYEYSSGPRMSATPCFSHTCERLPVQGAFAAFLQLNLKSLSEILFNCDLLHSFFRRQALA
jgi:hypothetical protein